jgi:hypothetical protein
MHRAAEKGGKAGAENDPGVQQVGTVDNAIIQSA